MTKLSPHIEITDQPIDEGKVIEFAKSDLAGAVVLFLGTTRRLTGNVETETLKYECYQAMAVQEMASLFHQAATRWPLQGGAMVHRIGDVPIGQTSVAIAVSTPHRIDAFAAGQWLIDNLKERVPIWKKECFSNGTSQWIHEK